VSKTLAATLTLLLTGCGARGPRAAVGRVAAAAAVTVAAAAATALIRGHRRRRMERGYVEPIEDDPEDDPDHDHPDEDVGDREPEPVRPQLLPLPLWHVPYAVEIEAEDLWCESDEECASLDGVDGCRADDGGVNLAIRRSSLSRLRLALSEAAPARSCPGGQDPSQDASPRCLDNLCRLVSNDHLGPVPPPPEDHHANLPPVPPPP